jgi:ribosomal protein L29
VKLRGMGATDLNEELLKLRKEQFRAASVSLDRSGVKPDQFRQGCAENIARLWKTIAARGADQERRE